MPDASGRTNIGGLLIVYAGRFADQVAGIDLPDDCVVLGEQDAPPHELAGVLDDASTFVLLDLPSFPLGVMTGDRWNVPMVVVLPPGFDAGSLAAAFGTALFERLGVFDRVATPDHALFEELRRRYRWANSQRVTIASNDPKEVVATICASSEVGPTPPATPEACGGRPSPYLDKASHRVQAAVLEPWFAARGRGNIEAPLDVLEVGAGAGRWASSFDPEKTGYVGIDVREDRVRAARANFPEVRFDLLGPDLLFPYEAESFDLVFGVILMHRYPTLARRTLLSEMWRVARPGGRLLFLENFVYTKQSEEPAVYPMSATEFEELIIGATAGRVALEHVESLRYPDEDLRRGGLLSLIRLGVPGTDG